MSESQETRPTAAAIKSLYRAGDIKKILTGTETYLAPLPLPTGAQPYCPSISDFNDVYLDFGGGKPNVFSYQLNLGGPFTSACVIAFGFPIFIGLAFVLLGSGWLDAWHAISDSFLVAWQLAIGSWIAGTTIGLYVWFQAHALYTKVIPTRFNRQRREVCFTPHDSNEPLFVPWEALSAWVVQSQSATQYGVTRQYGLGMGFEHEGEWVSLEFQCGGLPLAIAHWEAVRGYMEYELDDLKAIQDPLELQGPDDPSHEGLHTFRNARAAMHRRWREKEVGSVYAFFWYVYHVMTFWTLPNRLVEWEIKRIAKVGRRALPQAIREWSKPLPPEHRSTPSHDLVRLSANVRALQQRSPQRDITDIFAEVYRAEPDASDGG